MWEDRPCWRRLQKGVNFRIRGLAHLAKAQKVGNRPGMAGVSGRWRKRSARRCPESSVPPVRPEGHVGGEEACGNGRARTLGDSRHIGCGEGGPYLFATYLCKCRFVQGTGLGCAEGSYRENENGRVRERYTHATPVRTKEAMGSALRLLGECSGLHILHVRVYAGQGRHWELWTLDPMLQSH